MAESLFVTIFGGLALGLIYALLSVQRHVQDWYVAVGRGWRDYWRWSYDVGVERQQEYRRINRVYFERRLFGTEEHLAELERMMDRYAQDYQVRSRTMARAIDDAGRRLRRIDRVFMILTAREGKGQRWRSLKAAFTKEPFSMDAMLDTVDEQWRRGEVPDLSKGGSVVST